MAKYLKLRHANKHPDILSPTTLEVFKNLGSKGLLDSDEAEFLANAGSFWLALQAMLRLTTEGPFSPESASKDLKKMLTSAGKCDDFASLQDKIEATATRIKEIYDRIIAEPALKVTPSEEIH